MKTFKLDNHSAFPRPFGVRGKHYFGIGIMVFFDLTDSETLYTEQDMWGAVPKQLGHPPVLDQGIPKPRGEFLAAGACFAPRGETRPASKVRIEVGSAQKEINVFGNRYWKNGLITDPEPFSEIPVTWANAFGGHDFPENTQGKGMQEALLPDGSTAIPLPNLELPAHQIGSPVDRPLPACFGSVDIMAPQRAKKNGTYDEKWKAERWPSFPDDMNYEYFNTASEDQYIEGYFEGGEPITVKNMHPDMPHIESSLPRLRMRCFVTLDPTFTPHTFPTGPLPSQQLRDTDEFREISTRLETVWLFPSILRGVAIYRGTTEVIDEEGEDVTRLLIRHESMDEPPKSIEEYKELQLRLLNRGVDIDMSAFEEAIAKAKPQLLKARNIKKTVAAMKEQALGKTPTMPPPSPTEILEQSAKQLTARRANIDKLEAMATKMHASNGHRIEINLSIFDTMRAKIAEMQKKI